MFTKVKDIMTSASCLERRHTLNEALQIMREKRTEALPVVDEYGNCVGIFTWSSLLEKDLTELKGTSSVQEYANKNLITLEEDDWAKDVKHLPGDVFPVLNNDGKVTGVVFSRDVWAAYCNSTEYRAKELEAVFNCAHNGILAIDANGIITTINPAAERLAKRSKEESIGRFLTEVVVPAGLLEVVKSGTTQFGVKYQVGRRKYITNRTSIVQDGKVIGAVGVFQEITELEDMSEELNTVRELNKELETIIESSYDGIVITDPAGIVLRANRAMERLTGKKVNHIMGQPLTNVIHGKINDETIVDMAVRRKTVISTVDGNASLYRLLITANPVINEQGEVLRVVINVRDLTELDVLRKQIKGTTELNERYKHELQELRMRLSKVEGVVFRSPQMESILDIALKVARVDTTVLVLGESGVGKEVIAKVIHNNSQRSNGPFITVNCGAIPEHLLESELFGYEPGAFTGANKTGKPGMFELAHNGTIFLDEIGDIPQVLQVKLLRVLQNKEITRLGGTKANFVNVRIVAATNQDLQERVREGQFREDLYFRLNVVPIFIPPLRERREDIICLLNHLQNKFGEKYGLHKELTPEAVEVLVNYDWPGNVREMENILERLYVTTSGELITHDNLRRHLNYTLNGIEKVISVKGLVPLKEAVLELERQLIQKALEQYDTTYKVAEVLQVNQSTIVRKIGKMKDKGQKFICKLHKQF